MYGWYRLGRFLTPFFTSFFTLYFTTFFTPLVLCSSFFTLFALIGPHYLVSNTSIIPICAWICTPFGPSSGVPHVAK